jgi:hypothetical protein
MNKLTKQQIFDKVATHLMAQGQRSAREYSSECLYRGEGGLRCAVGFLIADEHYDERFEGSGVGWGLVEDSTDVYGGDYTSLTAKLLLGALEAAGVDTRNRATIELLGSLQAVHDNRDPSNWAESLRSVAVKFNLNTDVIAAWWPVGAQGPVTITTPQAEEATT